MSTLRGGRDKPHRKLKIETPQMSPHIVEFICQLKEIHREFGREGALRFIAETEARDALPKGSLKRFMSLFSAENSPCEAEGAFTL